MEEQSKVQKNNCPTNNNKGQPVRHRTTSEVCPAPTATHCKLRSRSPTPESPDFAIARSNGLSLFPPVVTTNHHHHQLLPPLTPILNQSLTPLHINSTMSSRSRTFDPAIHRVQINNAPCESTSFQSIVSHPFLKRRSSDRSKLLTPTDRVPPTDQPGRFQYKYESLDYEVCENSLYHNQPVEGQFKINFLRWFVIFLIAVLTALTAWLIVIAIDYLSGVKHRFLKQRLDQCNESDCMYQPFLFWVGMNGILVSIGSLLVTYFAPVAAGSGIPLIKCYLNGVKVPAVVRISTFVCKAIGVTTSVAGGLACGKEGPMIHCGSVIAAGISQGKSTTFKKDFKIFKAFREDREKRDFVSAGAASGVAAAFGAPVGALLFSLEEGASFWNQSLTWKIFFCSVMTTFSLNVVMSWCSNTPGQLNNPGLLNFGKFEDFEYSFYELPVYLLIGAAGGLFGALYNALNYRITIFRMKYIKIKYMKVLEATLAAMVTATVGFLLIMSSTDCRNNGTNSGQFVKLHCPPGEHSVMAELWFNTPEAIVKALFHNKPDSWNALTLAIFFIFYFIISCWTYGLSVSGGVFIPSLLLGAAGGRLLSIGLRRMLTVMGITSAWIFPGKFALIGAASMLGGVVRMTISLTVILIEATGNVTFGLPIMLSITVAKWVGDFLTYGLYDIHIRLNHVPILPWEPPNDKRELFADQVMSSHPTCFRTKETIRVIYSVLTQQSHNGFPVVDSVDGPASGAFNNSGRLRGLILRWQLIVLIEKRNKSNLVLEDFRTAYPRYPQVEDLSIPTEELDHEIDLTPYMNPSPYTVFVTASLARIFYLFRALGLRHLVVVDENNFVQGIVTRKDLAIFDEK